MSTPSPGLTTSPSWPNPQRKPLWVQSPVVGQSLPADYATATNAAAVVTYAAAGVEIAHSIAGVSWSYSAAPTGGSLTIADGSNTILSVDITAAGPGFLNFSPSKIGTPNQSMTITLAAGGSGIVGKLTVNGHVLVSGEAVLFGVDFSNPANSMYAGAL
jgi:hypothetical protein